MSLLDGPGHYGHSPVPYTILGALKSCGPTTAMVNMGLLGEVKHRNVTQKLLYICTCVLQCIGVDVYTELPCLIYISDAKAVYTLHKHTLTQFIMITYVA